MLSLFLLGFLLLNLGLLRFLHIVPALGAHELPPVSFLGSTFQTFYFPRLLPPSVPVFPTHSLSLGKQPSFASSHQEIS